jgi:Concanavalin A-like lectin/glucanases superfamily/Putative metal-binding motif/PKD domain/SprB repeat/CARDB/Fibronectin type III domain
MTHSHTKFKVIITFYAHILKLFSRRLNALLGLLRFCILVVFCCVSFGASGQTNTSTKGVTVITHGFQLTGGLDSHNGFLNDYAYAIKARAGGKANIFINDKNGKWVTIDNDNSGSSNDEIILLFDWSSNSNNKEKGYLEAAADQLFAMLLNPPSELGISRKVFLDKPKHFIAHSRGCVLMLQVFNRFNTYPEFKDIKIEQFTSLDPHPAVPMKDTELYGVDKDNLDREKGRNIFKLILPPNVVVADNYYQMYGEYESDVEFDGVFVEGAKNTLLTHNLFNYATDFCWLGVSGTRHTKVHAWYYYTLSNTDNIAPFSYKGCPPSNQWYLNYERQTSGYNKSRIGGVYLAPITKNGDTRNFIVESVFNGKSGSNSAGWDMNGGGVPNGYWENRNWIKKPTHSIMYFPTDFLYFSLKTSIKANVKVDFIPIPSISGSKPFSKAFESSDQSETHYCKVPAELLGKIGKFTITSTCPEQYFNFNNATLSKTPDGIFFPATTVTPYQPKVYIQEKGHRVNNYDFLNYLCNENQTLTSLNPDGYTTTWEYDDGSIGSLKYELGNELDLKKIIKPVDNFKTFNFRVKYIKNGGIETGKEPVAVFGVHIRNFEKCNGLQSTIYSFKTSSTSACSTQIPTNLQASDGVYPNKIIISWNGQAGYKYLVSRSKTNNALESIILTNGFAINTTSIEDVNVDNGTYYYFVRAIENDNYYSNFSIGDGGFRKPQLIPGKLELAALMNKGVAGSTLKVGTNYTFSTQIKNVTGSAWSGLVYLELNNRTVATTFLSINDGQTVSVSIPYTPQTEHVGNYLDFYLKYETHDYGRLSAVERDIYGNFDNPLYTITVVEPLPAQLTIQNASVSKSTAYLGETINVKWRNINFGELSTGYFNTNIYLSNDPILSSDDVLLVNKTISNLNGNTYLDYNENITIPTSVSVDNYYLLISIDNDNTVIESDESDNIVLFPIKLITCNTLAATITATPATCGKTNGQISVSVSGGDAPYSYQWNPTYVPKSGIVNALSAGTYSVTVTTAVGCTITKTATVTSTGSTATPQYNYRLVGKTAIFTNTSTNGDAFVWSFGDNTTSTEVNPTHTFANGGNYLVCLTAKNGTCSDVNCTNIAISNNGCEIPIGISSSSITQTSATIAWQASASANSYNLRYRDRSARNSPDAWVIVPNISALSHTLNIFFAANTYEIQVQTNCNVGVSDWSETYFFSTINPHTGTATVPYKSFYKKYATGSNITTPVFATTTTDGNIVVGSASGNDFTYFKMNTSGQTIWKKNIMFFGTLRGLEKTNDGGFIISTDRDDYQFMVIERFDATGNLMWWKNLNDSNTKESFVKVKATTDGGFIISGTETSYSTSVERAFLVKLDVNGNISWKNTYGHFSRNLRCYDVVELNNGGYMIGGTYRSDNSSVGTLIKVNSSGSIQWGRFYDVNTYTYSKSIDKLTKTVNGDIIARGFINSYSNPREFLMRVNPNDGSYTFANSYFANTGFYDSNIVEANDGTLFTILGKRLLKLAADGNVLYAKKLQEGTSFSYNNVLAPNPSIGDVFVVGSHEGQVAIAKTDEFGNRFVSCIEKEEEIWDGGSSIENSYFESFDSNVFSNFSEFETIYPTTYNTTLNVSEICPQCIVSTHIIVNKTNICPNENVVFASGGTGGSNYEWKINGVPVSTASSFQYKFPSSGSYTVSVTVSNNASCIATASETVVIGNVPTFAVVNINNESCNSSNGSASVNITEGASGASIVWSNGKTGISTTGLKAGNHAVIVIGANGCVAPAQKFDVNNVGTTDFTIKETIYPANCNTNGSISVLVENVVGTPTYRWSNGATTSFVSNLIAGTYTVTVSDGIGCSKSKSIVVMDLCCPLLTGFTYLGKQNCNCFYKSDAAVAISTASSLPAYTPVTGFSAKVATVYNAAVNALYTGQGYVAIGLRDNVAPTNCEANNSSNPKESNCWVWQDNTSMVYKNWAPVEPNGFTGENYVHVYNDGTWNDIIAGYVMQYGLQLTPNTGTQLYYADVDGDGYGRPNSQIRACTAPAGYVLNNLDCNDSNALIFPGGTEIVNGLDDDCDGRIDENVTDLCPLLSGFTYLGIENCNCFYKSNAAVAMSTAFNLPAYTPSAGFSAKVATVYNGAVNALYRGHGYVTIGLRDNVAPTNCEANNYSFPKESNCWVWQDNTSMVYKNWGINQPDNYLGQEHYVHVLNDGTWNDNSGNFLSLYGLQLTPNTVTQLYYADVDGDGYGRPNSQIRACTTPSDYVLNNMDCYDFNAPVTPPLVSSITETGASATWTTITGATYSLHYKPTSGTGWTTVDNLTTGSYNFTGLSANTEYQVQIKVSCTIGIGSAWTVVQTFTTLQPQTITISSPINGTFTAGQNATVTYASTNGTANVSLELVTCTGTVALATIATGVTSTGSLVYVLPSTLATGSYRIKAYVTGTTTFYYGTCFTVNVPQTIAITSPTSGTFTAGQDVTVTYASTNGTANVTLELVTCTGTTALLSIADDVAASGTRTYSLPSSLAAGSYRIKAFVTGTTGQVYYGACFNVLGCADLVVTNLQVTALSPYIQYSYTIKNIGTVSANLSSAILQAYVSSDIILGNTGDLGAGGTYLSGSLASNAVINGNFSGGVVNTNTHPYLVIKVDSNNGIVECNESNNTYYTLIPIQTIAISSPIGGTFTAGQDVTLTHASTNWAANVSLELVTCTGTTALAVVADGGVASGTRTYTLPTTLAAGSYRIKSYVTGTTGQAYYGACFNVNQSLNLVAQYPFNGNANDESGKGNHGIVQGGAILTTDRFGVTNKAYNFGGYNNRSAIRVPNSTTLQFTNTLSISFWYYMNTYQGMDGNGALSNYGLHSLITKDGDRGGFYSAISGDLANNNTNFGFANGASFGNYTGVDKAFPNMSNNLTLWTHISVVISTQDMKIFKNGVLAVTKALTTPMVFTTSNTKDLYFGTFFGVGSWFPLNAKLDDISIHNKALSDAEVLSLYNSEKPSNISFSIKAFLQGPYNVGLMNDDLRISNLIPTAQPYTSANGFTHIGGGGTETIIPSVLTVTGNNAIVDWLFIQLKDRNNTSIVATRAALLQRDGDIVDVDGVSPVTFQNIESNVDYYVIVKHRNHFGVMTAFPITAPTNKSVVIDFTDPSTSTWGTGGQKNVAGKMCLWAGDVNNDKRIRYNGANNDKFFVLQVVGTATPNTIINGYDRGDLNLDGKIRYNGANNDKLIILSNVGTSSPNNIIFEQISN